MSLYVGVVVQIQVLGLSVKFAFSSSSLNISHSFYTIGVAIGQRLLNERLA